MALGNKIAEFEFGSAQWQFANGEAISTPIGDRPMVKLCMEDGKVKYIGNGPLVTTWEERMRLPFGVRVSSLSGSDPVVAGYGRYFAPGDLIRNLSDSTGALGRVGSVSGSEALVLNANFQGNPAPTFAANDRVEKVAFAGDENLDEYSDTKEIVYNRFNSFHTVAVKRKISDRVNPDMFKAIGLSAGCELFDQLDALVILGHYDQDHPQGTELITGVPPDYYTPVMQGLVQAFIGDIIALGPPIVRRSGTDFGPVADYAAFQNLLEASYFGRVSGSALQPANIGFDLIIAGTNAMRRIYDYQNDTPGRGIASRLTYFRAGGCSCENGDGRARTACFDSPWGKIDIIATRHLPSPWDVYLLRRSDLSFVFDEKPRMVMLPRTDGSFVLMVVCRVSLQYVGQTLWWKGTLA